MGTSPVLYFYRAFLLAIRIKSCMSFGCAAFPFTRNVQPLFCMDLSISTS